jgi:lipopolysaccharide export LptBFGC system permease protein LptF
MHHYVNELRDKYDMPTFTIQQFEQISLIVCCSALMLYMLFVLYRLGKDSNAGKFGMFVIFFALSLGVFGFAMKSMVHLFVI